jgi:hypothetical protein
MTMINRRGSAAGTRVRSARPTTFFLRAGTSSGSVRFESYNYPVAFPKNETAKYIEYATASNLAGPYTIRRTTGPTYVHGKGHCVDWGGGTTPADPSGRAPRATVAARLLRVCPQPPLSSCTSAGPSR